MSKLGSTIPLIRGKAPGYSRWQEMSEDEVRDKWAWAASQDHPVNVGLRLGPGVGQDRCDIDLDSKESRILAKYYLPSTIMFGRGGVCTHYLYTQTGDRKTKVESKRYQWDKRDEKSVLLEFRASGQTMAPGSVHPDTGEKIEWMCEPDALGEYVPREVVGGELIQHVNHLAAASLLLRDWNAGNRDEIAVCLVGSMLRGGWECRDIDGFLEPILLESGDEESGMRMKSDRLERVLKDGGRVPGLPRLKELWTGGGRQGFNHIVEWLGLGGQDLMDEMNMEYAVIPMGSKVFILREWTDGDGKAQVDFLVPTALNMLCAHKKVDVGRGRSVGLDKFWMEHPERRIYPKGVVFRPGQDARDGEYNLWKGFSVAPVEGKWGEGWDIYLQHLLGDVCAGRNDLRDYLLGWMAHRVQRPWEPAGSAVVLVGTPGNGKSSVFKIFGRLFGQHYGSVTHMEHLTGKFNYHLKDKVLVLADEATWGGDKQREGVLKTFITEPTRVIEMKGKDAVVVANCTGLGICSNNDWVVPVGRGDRRYFVTRVGDERVGNKEYWDRMYDQMSVTGGGLGRMLWDLKGYDLSGWRSGAIPDTEAKDQQAEASGESYVQFMSQVIYDGWLAARLVDGGGWSYVEWNRLTEGYLSWCERMRIRPLVPLRFRRSVESVLGASAEESTRIYKLVDGVKRGINILVFTGGLGETSRRIREWVSGS